MSNFLAGFAAEGVKQLDRYAADQKEKAKIEDARKYNESRYEIERKDRKRDSLDAINLQERIASYKDVSGLYLADDKKTVMGEQMQVGEDGTITVTHSPVTDPGRIKRWEEYKAEALRTDRLNTAKLSKAESDAVSAAAEAANAGALQSARVQTEREQAANYRRGNRSSLSDGPSRSIYKQLPVSEKTIIDSIALGDSTYLQGSGITPDSLRNPRPLTSVPSTQRRGRKDPNLPKNNPSYVELARRVQTGGSDAADAYRELLPLLETTYKVGKLPSSEDKK